MENYNLFVMDDTEAFANRLSSQMKENGAAITVFWAPDADTFNELIVNYTAHAFIISQRWQSGNAAVDTGKALRFTLAESRQEGEDCDFSRDDSMARVAAKLIREIMGHTQVIGVFGACGGAGNTTMCMGLAQALVRHGQRVFFLSLESCMADSPFADPGKVGLSEVLLALDDGSDLEATIRKACCPSRRVEGVEAFYTGEYDVDRVELQPGDIGRILEVMRKMNRWDAILVDMESRMSDTLFEVWEASNRMVLMVPQTKIALEKMRGVERDLRLRQKRGEADLSKLVPVVNYATTRIEPEFSILGRQIRLYLRDLNSLRQDGVRGFSSMEMCSALASDNLYRIIRPVLNEVWEQ